MIENFINELLSQLGAGSRESVYLSVTPGVGLELIQIDPVLKAVKAYGHKPLDYNDSMREISNYDDFKTALQELYTELGINPKCNVYLNLPMVHFGKIELPILLNDESITEAITSEVEQSYIFKKCEPVVSWFEGTPNTNSETRTIFYSALQKEALERIKADLTELGSVLCDVEVSLISSLRALAFAGFVDMSDNKNWNLMTINSSGYSIVSMLGTTIVDYYEEPLPLKTYEMDEIYDVINTSAQIALMNLPANYLYVVSNTDIVSAEHLSGKLQIDGTVNYLDNNSFRKREILPVSLNILPDQIMKISLEAVGIAVTKNYNFPVKLDFSGKRTPETGSEETISFVFRDKEIVLTETVLKNIAYVIAAILIIPSLIALLTLPIVQKNNQAKLDELNKKIEEIDTQIKALDEEASTAGAFVIKNEIEKVVKNNRAKLLSYSALGEAVPKNLWITYFMTKEDGKIDIKGLSENVEDIYKFFKNMKDSLINTKLRLQELEMMSTSLDDVIAPSGPSLYQFEITNMSEAELNPQPTEADNANKTDNNKPNNPPKNQTNNKNQDNSSKKVDDLEPIGM